LNYAILNNEVQQFINTNLKSEITKLILKGSPFNNVSMQELAEQITAKNKCKKKLQTWYATENIYFPNRLNIEQTSSERTANYKANLVSGNSLVDITGGFGVDSFYFAQKIDNVTHCEINEELSSIVSHNFESLNIKNIKTHIGDGLKYLENTKEKFDWIYTDPSRRDDAKGKVFLLEDCLPIIPNNIDILFNKSDQVLIKISPFLDITSAIKELKFVKEVHIIAIDNDVKELLFILKKDYNQNIDIKTINILQTKKQQFDFTYRQRSLAIFSKPKKYLYEPNSAILKAGAFNQISEYLNIDKLHQHSHLYTSNKLINFPGRKFEIKYCIPYTKKLLHKLLHSKKANITTRNFPETVAQIRKKTKLKDGGKQYLFFTTDLNNNHIVLICEKLI